MDDELVRLHLELPLRDWTRRTLARTAPSLQDPRLAEAQADVLERVIREVLDGLELSPETFAKGLALAADALRRAAGEEEHDDFIVSFDQHRPPPRAGQQR